MSFQWIRKNYHVPAKIGGRVEYTGAGAPQLGTIRGSKGAYLRIGLDGGKRLGLYHPTWELRYLDDAEEDKP
jgi:hypothetical protein